MTDLNKFISHITQTLIAHEGKLTALDQAIGDGDHGINMRRGSEALQENINAICALPFNDAMTKLGMTLVMSIGGASGPLYGTLAMSMGKVTNSFPDNTVALSHCMGEALTALKARGKSDVGAKTMLDILGPVCDALNEPQVTIQSIRKTADDALAATPQGGWAPMLVKS